MTGSARWSTRGPAHSPRWWYAAVLAGATGVALVLPEAGDDPFTDGMGASATQAFGAVGRLAGSVTVSMGSVGWTVVGCLALAAALHYAAAAVAARAAAGRTLPRTELLLAQFAAASANRLTPAGLGGAAVLVRFYTRRGRLTSAQSVAAVSSLTVLGGVADVIALAALIGIGAALGLSAVGREVPALVARLQGLVPVPAGGWSLVAAGGVAVLAVLLAVPAVRRRVPLRRATAIVRQYAVMIAALAVHPVRLAVLLLCSAGTTLALAAAFATAAVLGPVHLSAGSFAALMVGYMVAAAAASTVPTPGGVGATDAAFVGVLLAAHAAVPSAVATVIVFRVVTFWAPAVLGLPCVRILRRRGGL